MIAKLHVQPVEVYPWDVELKTNGRNGAAIATAAKKFFDESGDKPFFLLVGYTDPHRAKRGFDTQVPLKGMPTVTFDPKTLPLPYFLPDQPDARADFADYYGSVARLDFGVGPCCKPEGREARCRHARDLPERQRHPLPRREDNALRSRPQPAAHHPQPGRRRASTRQWSSWTDIAPTILDWAGVKPPPAMGGKSLLPLSGQDDAKDRDVVFGSHQFHEITMYYPMPDDTHTTVQISGQPRQRTPLPGSPGLYNSDTWQGILSRGDKTLGERSLESFTKRSRHELYDLEKDPKELKNLAADPAYAKTLKDLQKRLKDWQTATKDPWLVKYTHD